MLYRAILFDLDGTLVDSYRDAEHCWSDWADSVGVGDDFDLSRYYGRKRADIIRDLLPDLSEAEIADHAKQVRLAEGAYTGQTVALPGAGELLNSLPADRWAIVTSNDTEVAQARLRAAGLPVPTVLVSEDEVTHAKPHPEAFLLGASRLGIDPPTAIAVDDSPIGIEAANAAGSVTIGVRFRHDNAALAAAHAVYDNVGSIPFQLVGDNLLIQLND